MKGRINNRERNIKTEESEMEKYPPNYYRHTDLIIFVYDVTKKSSFKNIRLYNTEVELIRPNPIKFLIANKIDLPDRKISSIVCFLLLFI